MLRGMNAAMASLPEPTTAPAAPLVRDVDAKDFAAEVLLASQEVPVLVDFWAPWCGPCKQLAPVLEKAVTAAQGKVRLVKMDIDRNPGVAGQLGIQSIPAVFAFFQGRPVDGFVGVQSDAAVKQFVERLAKLAGGANTAIAEALAEAEGMLEGGRLDEAGEIYTAILQHDATNAPAFAGLLKVLVAQGQSELAEEMLAKAAPELANDKALQSVKAQLQLLAKVADAGPVGELSEAVLADPAAHDKRFKLAQALVAANRHEEAIDHLIEIIRRDRAWNEEAARKELLTVFEALGHMHELSVAGRRKLSAVIFR